MLQISWWVFDSLNKPFPHITPPPLTSIKKWPLVSLPVYRSVSSLYAFLSAMVAGLLSSGFDLDVLNTGQTGVQTCVSHCWRFIYSSGL